MTPSFLNDTKNTQLLLAHSLCDQSKKAGPGKGADWISWASGGGPVLKPVKHVNVYSIH